MKLFRRKKKRKRDGQNPRRVLIMQILIGIFLLVFVGLIGTGVWYGSRIEALTIEQVEVIGGETIDHERIYDIADEELEGSYYRLVPRRFAWTYPQESIRTRIIEIERVKNAHVERTSGTELAIAFEEHKPFALWCLPAQAGETLPSDCVFLDRDGFAFGRAPKLEGGAFVRFSETDRVPEVNTNAFNGEFVRSAESFISRAYDELGLNIIQVEKTAGEEVTYHIAGGGELKVSLRMSADETLENLETILYSEQFDHIGPGNFQYIDLRYGNKVFVNEELPSETTATSATSSINEE